MMTFRVYLYSCLLNVSFQYVNLRAWFCIHTWLHTQAKSLPCPTADTLAQKLRMLAAVPRALMVDMEYTRGVPNTWPAVGAHLKKHVGFEFPCLSGLNSQTFLGKRAICAIATVLLDNYDVSASVVTLPVKVLAGAVYARVVRCDALQADFEHLASVYEVSTSLLLAARELGDMSPSDLGGDVQMLPSGVQTLGHSAQCYLLLARALAPSPAQVSQPLVKTLIAAKLAPEGIVELVNFLAITQLQLRVGAFYPRIESR
jgi:hypothetical protein